MASGDRTPVVRAATFLVDRVDCPVLLPGARGYDVARRVWNADIDRHPAAIVRCRDRGDVSRALVASLDNGREITVRGGGHNVAGTAVMDDAVLIDTGGLDQIHLDPDAGTITVGAGCRWGDVDRFCADVGVVVPAGVVSHTGVAGLTLGGGTGYLSRLHGATVDHLESVDVVLADGRTITASVEEHDDLFWALRGAGHNYAVATAFTFRYQTAPDRVQIRQALFGESDRRAVLRFVRDWALTLPASITTYTRLLTAPPYWSQVPTRHRGRPIVSVAAVCYGDPEDVDRLTAPLFAAGHPIWQTRYSLRHVQLQHSVDDEFRFGLRRYWKHGFLNEISDAAIEVLLDHCDRYPGRPLQAHSMIAPQLNCPFEMLNRGGQLLQVDPDSTAMSDYTSLWSTNIGADWEFAEEADPLVHWAREFDAAMTPFQVGSYINFTSVQGDVGVARAVYGRKYERLTEVKKEYDPENVFRRGLADLRGSGGGG